MTAGESGALPAPRLDVDDPMVRTFIERVCDLAPAQWDRLAGAEAAPVAAPARRLPPVLAALDALMRLSERAIHAPLTRWWGAGPYRRLGEVLDRPYVQPGARTAVMWALLAVKERRGFEPQFVWELYEPVEPVIPWDSLGGDPRPWGTPRRLPEPGER